MNSTSAADTNFVFVDANDLNTNKNLKDSFTWTDDATKLLIREYRNHGKNIGKYPQLQTKKDLWDLITRELNKHGYNLTSIQTRNRLTTLGRAFKKKLQRSGTPQKIVRDPELQNELNEIFLMKPYEEFPAFEVEGHEENQVQDTLDEISFPNTPFIFANESKDSGDMYKWDHRTTELLFNVYDEVNKNGSLVKQFRTKMNMWNHITERLNEYGFIFSSLQVQNRIKTIIRAYKRHLRKNQSADQKVSVFPFEDQIKRVIKNQSTLTYKKDKEDLFDNSLDEYDIGDKDDIANIIVTNPMSSSCVSPNTNTIEPHNEESVLLKEIRLLREEKHQFRNDFLKFHTEHVDLLREENFLLRENNQLLKSLIDKLTNGNQSV